MSETAWNTVKSSGAGAAFEPSSAIPTRVPWPAPSNSWSPTGSPAGSPRRTRPCGDRRPRTSPASGSRGSPLGDLAPAGHRDRDAAGGACGSGPAPGRALRHGRLLARTGGDLRRGRRSASSSSTRTPGFLVRAALEDRLAETVVVVSSKSGGTVETDSWPEARLREGVYRRRHRPGGADDRRHRPRLAYGEGGARGRLPGVPGRSGRRRPLLRAHRLRAGSQRLAGADIAGLLDEAEAIRPALEADSVDNPGLRLGGLLGPRTSPASTSSCSRTRVRHTPASATGPSKHRGVHRKGRSGHPAVVVDAPDSPTSPPARLIARGRSGPTWSSARSGSASGFGVSVDALLGAQLLLWEYATAVAGRIIGINLFDQPDVESAKNAARAMLDAGGATPTPLFVDGPVTVYASDGWLPDGTTTVSDAVAALLDVLDPARGYLSVQAYLDRHRVAPSRRAATRWRSAPGVRSRSGGGLGSCTPPAVPQGRTRHRGLPPGDRRPAGRPGRPGPGRSRSRSSCSRRPSATAGPRRARPAWSCACTSAVRDLSYAPCPPGGVSHPSRSLVALPTPRGPR